MPAPVSRWKPLLVLGISALALTLLPPGPAPQASAVGGRVFTLLDYFRSGRGAVERFIRADAGRSPAGDLASVIRRSQKACARVEIRLEETAGAYQSIRASGVLVAGGRTVLTAGHSLQEAGRGEILVTFHHGESRRAHLRGQEYLVYGGAGHDWAVLELVGAPVTGVPGVELGEARTGSLAIVLGYPDEIGIDTAGRVAYAADGAGFLPLVTLATVLERDPLLLAPEAGSVPVGGMSGGPIFDRDGRLVGIFSSVGRIVRSDGVSYVYNGAALPGLQPMLTSY